MEKTQTVIKHFLIIGLVILFLCPPFTVTGAKNPPPLPEYKIKAVYLYKLIQFIRWPEENKSSENIIIGILGKDPFGDAFSDVEEKEIKSLGRKLVIKRFGPYHNSLPLSDCDLLFICASEKKHFKKITESLLGIKVLTFSDTEGFLEHGGMIKFIKAGEKIRWEMNKKAIDASGIKINAQIYQSALKVLQ